MKLTYALQFDRKHSATMIDNFIYISGVELFRTNFRISKDIRRPIDVSKKDNISRSIIRYMMRCNKESGRISFIDKNYEYDQRENTVVIKFYPRPVYNNRYGIWNIDFRVRLNDDPNIYYWTINFFAYSFYLRLPDLSRPSVSKNSDIPIIFDNIDRETISFIIDHIAGGKYGFDSRCCVLEYNIIDDYYKSNKNTALYNDQIMRDGYGRISWNNQPKLIEEDDNDNIKILNQKVHTLISLFQYSTTTNNGKALYFYNKNNATICCAENVDKLCEAWNEIYRKNTSDICITKFSAINPEEKVRFLVKIERARSNQLDIEFWFKDISFHVEDDIIFMKYMNSDCCMVWNSLDILEDIFEIAKTINSIDSSDELVILYRDKND